MERYIRRYQPRDRQRLPDAALDYFEAEGMMYSRIETLACNERGQRFYQQAGYQEVACQIYYRMHISDRKQV